MKENNKKNMKNIKKLTPRCGNQIKPGKIKNSTKNSNKINDMTALVTT